MTLDEAKLLLDATTLSDGTEPADEALLRAREMMQRNPALADWIKNRRNFDERAAQALENVPVPEGIRERILQRIDKQKPQPRAKGAPWTLFALAACIVFAVAWLGWWMPQKATEVSKWESDSLATVAGLNDGKLQLDLQKNDLSVVKGFLAKAGSPVPGGLPKIFASMPLVGCKVFKADGHPASVVCFEMAPGKLAHLVVLNVPPSASKVPIGNPFFEEHGDWHTANWSDGHQTYMIGTRASMDELKRLFT